MLYRQGARPYLFIRALPWALTLGPRKPKKVKLKISTEIFNVFNQ